ncbi:MAG: CopG family transcriptional regulator [Moraxella sp.]|uniref:CopG family transcriptional regulator n=1 Tax=Moraxella sp. TaxID=479 RepID=UPI0026DD5D1F|nr:CopG family transcriptional regulator [Moraxella sp.]MDO4450074.1 CopG family transcriptional regulator [Moraxella sp.]
MYINHTLRPIHLRLTNEIVEHLEKVKGEHGFESIQPLIRLYIRQGLDRDNSDYSLSHDVEFINELKEQGISEHVIEKALANVCKKVE